MRLDSLAASPKVTLAPSTDVASLRAYARTVIQALAPAMAADDASIDAWLARATGDAKIWLADADGRLAGGLLVAAMGHFLHGARVSMAGINAVAIAPELRARGVATSMMHACVRRLRDEGYALSSLYPATWTLYRRAGYAVAGTHQLRAIPVHALPSADRSHDVAPLDPTGDRARVESLYRAWAIDQHGALDRGEWLWRRTLHSPRERRYGYWFSRAGRDVAYLLYAERETPTHDYDLVVVDFVARDVEAIRAVWGFLGAHRSMGRNVLLHVAPGDPRVVALAEPPRHAIVEEFHWMTRVLDVPRALGERRFPSGISSRIALRVRDDVIAENDATFIVSIDDRAAHVERSTATASALPTIDLDVRALASLYTGLLSARSLVAMGQLSGDAAALDLCDAIFASPAPWLPDMF